MADHIFSTRAVCDRCGASGPDLDFACVTSPPAWQPTAREVLASIADELEKNGRLVSNPRLTARTIRIVLG